ncbi:hypothetical protein COO91_10717 (plasmid) [Nostoc flagelliforme CCNUN1]|uniref:Uncharacterized protein n=1 Tax=Nostoc flagelliforme CCNUN1 TaxID=2038116 RepID=A0A2K8T9Z6_9NOSO|nr:hypothetical protein COO91_10717 [Nostoc flagelliforme CCNUN1]
MHDVKNEGLESNFNSSPKYAALARKAAMLEAQLAFMEF